MNQNKDIDKYEAIRRTQGKLDSTYKNKLTEIIKNANSSLKKGETLVVYLDKKESIDDKGIGKLTSYIDAQMSPLIKYSKLYMIPKITNKKIGKCPYSYEFIA